jgi:tetratricopeptide (TPR) repeat protein
MLRPIHLGLGLVIALFVTCGASADEKVSKAKEAPKASEKSDSSSGQSGEKPSPAVKEAETPAPTGKEPEKPLPAMTELEVFNYLLKRTAFVHHPVTGGTSFGTGWIVDLDRKLVVTNLHVVEVTSGLVDVHFPAYDNDEVIREPQHYFNNIKPIRAKVVWTDRIRDLGLIQLDSLPADLAAVPLAKASASVGQQLFSLAGLPRGSEGLWIFTQGPVRSVYKRSLAQGGPIRVVETQMPLNQGNSGGAIVNNRGELVAVFEGLQLNAQLVNMCIDIAEVKDFLAKGLPLVETADVELLNDRGDGHFEEKRFDRAMDDYTAALAINPKSARSQSNRGWVFKERKDFETAIAEFNAALQNDAEMVEAYHGRALARNAIGKHDEAIEDLTQAIRRKPEEASLFSARGDTYTAKGDYDSAVKEYDKAIEKSPKIAQFHANRGDALTQLGRYEDAFKSLDQATIIEPSNAEFFNLAGNMMFAQEQYEKAVILYDLAIQKNGKEAMYFRNRADSLRKLNRFDDAAKSLTTASELEPSNDGIANQLGLVLFDAGQFGPAVEAFTKAISLSGNDASYYGNRGDANHRLARYDAAIADLTRAIALNDKEAAYFAVRGESQQLKGNGSAAVVDFKRAVELDPQRFEVMKTRFVVLANNSGKEIRVQLRYFTVTKEGGTQWFPSEETFLTFTFQPGESAQLLDEAFKVHASRIRFFAESTDGATVWNDHKDADLAIVPDEGYISDGGTKEFKYEFNP